MTQQVLDKPIKVKTVWQTVNGIVLLDKALGASSNQALQQVRRVYKAAKAGHTGTLDPLATGLLPLCLGEASKFAQGLLDSDKTYTARLCLGVMTATGDAEGEVLERKPVKFGQTQLNAVIAQYTGAIEQIPPMYSALKHQGRPLYELARQGIDIERAPRAVTIYSLIVLGTSFEGDVDCGAGQAWIDIEAKVSKGTYIRTLGQDIGAALCCGAHLSALRRTAVAGWTVDDAATLEALQGLNDTQLNARLLATDAMLDSLTTVKIDAAQQILFSNGGRVRVEVIGSQAKIDATVRVYQEDQFLGVAELRNGVLYPIRLIGKESFSKKTVS
jgi:tRNA pseudouridine55 synthase